MSGRNEYFGVGMIRLIYASDLNGCIGVNNTLPWNVPSDLKRFKELTSGCIVIMGRKTYDSLPTSSKPLPNRSNVVVSRTLGDLDRNMTFIEENVLIIRDLEYYLAHVSKTTNVWIIGGAQIYKKAIPYVEEVHHTEIYTEIEGDTFFNITDYSEFKLTQETAHPDKYLYRIYTRV